MYEVGRQCDQYLDALSRFNRQPQANRQGLIAVAVASGAILGPAGVTTTAIAITAVAFGLSASLFDASASSALFTLEASALRNIVQRGQELYLARIAKDKIADRFAAAPDDRPSGVSPRVLAGGHRGQPQRRGRPRRRTRACHHDSAGRRQWRVVNGRATAAVQQPAGGRLPQEPRSRSRSSGCQKALGVAGNGTYGAETRDAIREFQTAMCRRNPLEWPCPKRTAV